MEIDWRKDYKREFTCPRCNEKGMKLAGKSVHGKQQLQCPTCKKVLCVYYDIKIDLRDVSSGINWRLDYRIGEFACPNPDCEARNVYLHGYAYGKRFFGCKSCGATAVASHDLTKNNFSRYAHRLPNVKPFKFDDDIWDLRSINTTHNSRMIKIFIDFNQFKPKWFQGLAKLYILHLCKLDTPFSTLWKKIGGLVIFSRYMVDKSIGELCEINRDTMLDFIIWCNAGADPIRDRLGALRDFFWIGTIHGWFEIDQDLIRDDDYPKVKRGNPDPISDTVREQIEQNLHKLPDSIARMWLIAFFTAMRPSELAFLRKDCLIQEGSHWKINWSRNKGKDQHEVPVTRVIAKVVQEQVEYIENLWGSDWEYLFCHYQEISGIDLSHPRMIAVKKVIPSTGSPLQKVIQCLVKALDLRDDNGNLARFSTRLVRPTRLTQLFEQGHDLAIVSAWAGHKRLVTTSLFYTAVSCDLIEKEAGHIQQALLNVNGQYLSYESLPNSFWENPRAHQLDLSGDHINTPIYGFCGLPLDERCDKFRACYTCPCFIPTPEKLLLYIKTRDELRAKESKARENGQDVLVEQFGRQADQLDKVIARFQEEP